MLIDIYREDLKPRVQGDYSPMPNVVWGLELTPGPIATYGYLLSRENRKTYRCYLSFEEIGNAIGRSKRSVPEYVAKLVEKRLIEVKNTTLTLIDGTKNNGTLEYHLLDPQIAVKHFNDNYEARAAAKTQKPKKERKKRDPRSEAALPVDATTAASTTSNDTDYDWLDCDDDLPL